MNKSKKLFDGLGKTRLRRERVVTRLEAQLKSGVKPGKEEPKDIPLVEADIKRIKAEIAILKTRI